MVQSMKRKLFHATIMPVSSFTDLVARPRQTSPAGPLEVMLR
jgi:hypothetical protein